MMVNVFLQNDKNSRIRNKYNEKNLKLLKRDELLSEAEYQYGFIPGTMGEDGDCIDIWLISDKNYDTGMLIPCRVIGSLMMYEEYAGEIEEDFKVFVCPEDEKTELKREVVLKIRTFTLEIFRKYPEVKISFGETLSAEETELLLNERPRSDFSRKRGRSHQ